MEETMKKVYIVTGAAGFIGFHLTKELLKEEIIIVGIDNLNTYYDVELKYSRLEVLEQYSNFKFFQVDISNEKSLSEIFEEYQPSVVVNLAAQAGVRYSIENPDVYIESNIRGFYNILELCRKYPVDHLIYASSSSVYGENEKVPFEESDSVDEPVSLYAATKKTNELMAQTYSHLYKIRATGLRFFTVYGPAGRPDMAYFGFVDKYFKDEPIKIFNDGAVDSDLYRDFTYIDDIVSGIKNLITIPLKSDRLHDVYNIGNNKPEKLMDFINTLENCLSISLNSKVEFKKEYLPMQPGDVPRTYASIDKIQQTIGFKPQTTIEKGLQQFTDWYVKYYKKTRLS